MNCDSPGRSLSNEGVVPPEPVGVAESSANVALKRRSDGQSLSLSPRQMKRKIREREGGGLELD